jgi:hypothetical protein
MPITPMPAYTAERLQQLQQLLPLLESTDSVRLKLTVPETFRRSAIESFPMDPLDAEPESTLSTTPLEV